MEDLVAANPRISNFPQQAGIACGVEVWRGGLGWAYRLPTLSSVGASFTVFGACSAFTRVTACTLAKSPSDSLHQRLQWFRCLHYCSDCYRVERTSSRAGLTLAVDHHLFTAHPVIRLTSS